MNSEIVEAFSQIAREKNIDKEHLTEILHGILVSMIKKKYGTADNFEIFISMDKGEIEIYQTKTVVETVRDENTEIDLQTARKVEPTLELGDQYVEIVDPASFGRRLIISAKQNLNQKIKDAEKEIIFEEYQNRIGEILIGDVRQVNRDEIFINVDRTEVVMPRSEQIPTEHYRRGESVRAVVKEVRRSNRGPEIIVSRADPQFLMRLFELEVPEIYDGIIEIKAVAREPGERAKVAVYSNDKRIDAVGACVGMKGVRIQAIVKELHNEKIDIINWSPEIENFIARSLSPAKALQVIVDETHHKAIAILPDDQISLAIGRGGQNRRLASRLTGYTIETIKESQYREILAAEKAKRIELHSVEGLTPRLLDKLEKSGFHTVKEVLDAGIEGLMQVPGIGEKTAQKIWGLVQTESLERTEAEQIQQEREPKEEVEAVS